MGFYMAWIFCKGKEEVYRGKSIAKYFDLEPSQYLKQKRATNNMEISNNDAVVILILKRMIWHREQKSSSSSLPSSW